MINIQRWVLCSVVGLGITFGSFAWVFGASQEIRQTSQMAGTIVAPVEERKQALSSGDKIFAAMEKTRPVKKGDVLEIFQQAVFQVEGKPVYPLVRAGQVTVLEIVNEHLLLCIIESSTKEIAVGDRLFFPEQ